MLETVLSLRFISEFIVHDGCTITDQCRLKDSKILSFHRRTEMSLVLSHATTLRHASGCSGTDMERSEDKLRRAPAPAAGPQTSATDLREPRKGGGTHTG